MPEFIILNAETTGLDCNKHLILETSLALCNTENPYPEKILYIANELEQPAWQPDAIKIHSPRIKRLDDEKAIILEKPVKTLEFCNKKGISVLEYVIGKKSFPLISAADIFPIPGNAKCKKWLLCGKNPQFALSFLEKNRWFQVFKLPYDYHTLDIGNLLLLFSTGTSKESLLQVRSLKSYAYLIEDELGLTDLGFSDSITDVIWVCGLVFYCFRLFKENRKQSEV
ncbi:hypothetical protein ACFL35_14100 [Candidatus Riflebacteria bacterium]